MSPRVIINFTIFSTLAWPSAEEGAKGDYITLECTFCRGIAFKNLACFWYVLSFRAILINRLIVSKYWCSSKVQLRASDIGDWSKISMNMVLISIRSHTTGSAYWPSLIKLYWWSHCYATSLTPATEVPSTRDNKYNLYESVISKLLDLFPNSATGGALTPKVKKWFSEKRSSSNCKTGLSISMNSEREVRVSCSKVE